MKKYLVLLLFGGILISCGGNESEQSSDNNIENALPELDYEGLLSEINDLENKINSVEAPSSELLKDGIKKYQEFANSFPEDPKAPEYLLKASDFALNTKQPEKAVKILNQIIVNYPDFNRMEDVLFNKASHLDFELRDTTLAKETYQEFIEKYPESELVDDAQSRIENIRFSMEEMVEKFINDLEEQPK